MAACSSEKAARTPFGPTHESQTTSPGSPQDIVFAWNGIGEIDVAEYGVAARIEWQAYVASDLARRSDMITQAFGRVGSI